MQNNVVLVILRVVTAVADISLSDPAFWALPDDDRMAALARLRRDDPVSWHEAPDADGFPGGRGYWAITRHADVRRISRDHEAFCSGLGTEMFDLPIEVSRRYGGMMNMDAPEHTRLRRIVRDAFVPSGVARLHADIEAEAARVISAIAPRGECDFASDVAAIYPVGIVCRMLGIPLVDGPALLELTTRALGFGDSEVGGWDESYAAALELIDYGMWLARQRRAAPSDDLVSALVAAEVDGEHLDDAEIGSFFELLVTAGIETTGTAVAQGLRVLCEQPDQLRAWRADPSLTPTAVDEIVRWVTPVIHFRRTATRDVHVGDVLVREGDKVVLWYLAANRDERVFVGADRFDVRRTPNDHVGFGAGGHHFCLGAHLARAEIAALFAELFRQLGEIEVTGEPVRLTSMFVNGLRSLPIRWTPGGSSPTR